MRKLKLLNYLLKLTYFFKKPIPLFLIGLDFLINFYWQYYFDTNINGTIYGFLGSLVFYIGIIFYFYKLNSELDEDLVYLNQENKGGFVVRSKIKGALGSLHSSYDKAKSKEVNKIFSKHLSQLILSLVLFCIGLLASHLKMF